MCGFVQNSNDKFDWTRRKGSTPSGATGPSVDHTTGNGMKRLLDYIFFLYFFLKKESDVIYCNGEVFYPKERI